MKAEIAFDSFDPGNNPRHFGQFGGNSRNPTWEEYLDGFKAEFQPYISAIRECIERTGLVGKSASQLGEDFHFSFEDGTRIAFTWRAWGDLMQAIVGKREGYMTYYYSQVL